MQFIDLPTDPEQRISRLYCWVAINADGSEGVVAAALGGRQMVLVTSKRRLALAMENMAEAVALASAAAGRPCRMELRAFDLSDVVPR